MEMDRKIDLHLCICGCSYSTHEKLMFMTERVKLPCSNLYRQLNYLCALIIYYKIYAKTII